MIREILEAEGAPARQAAVQAAWLAEGDLRGRPSHGIQRLPMLVQRIRQGVIDPAADPVLEWRAEAAASVDGMRGLGPWIGSAAVNAVAERASSSGIAIAAVHNANHLGMLAPYVELAAGRGVVCIAMTTTEALVHPWGGSQAMIGTNPLAIGVPTDDGPFVLDMATSAVSMGEIFHRRHLGEPMEAGWAVDDTGVPTTDPARASAISPFGGAKGYGLGLAIELLVALLTGSALGTDVTGTLDAGTVCNKGDVFICISPGVVSSSPSLGGISRYLSDLREAPAQPGSRGVAIPGDGTRRRRRRSIGEGVEISDATWREIARLRADPPA